MHDIYYQGEVSMKKILVINPSLRLQSTSKFLPVGIASVMTYLKNLNIEFDLLDIDIHEIEDDDVVAYLENNRYDLYNYKIHLFLYTGFLIFFHKSKDKPYL